jgi:F-type H+-transporting ATPase subunit b
MFNESFFIFLATIIFFVLFGRAALKALKGVLEKRIEAIKTQLAEAQNLKEEAQNILAISKGKQSKAYEEAQQIIDHAKAEANLLKQTSLKECELILERRETMALERIKQMEEAVAKHFRQVIGQVAVESVEHLLAMQPSESSEEVMHDVTHNVALYKPKKTVH